MLQWLFDINHSLASEDDFKLMSKPNTERETAFFTIPAEVIQAAIKQVISCETCNPDDAEFRFEIILDRVLLFSGAATDYFMPELPLCPRCKRLVAERTLVEWDGGGTEAKEETGINGI